VAQTWLDFQQALLDMEQGEGADIDLDSLIGWNNQAANRTQAAGNFGSLGDSPSSNELAFISWPTPEFTPTETSSPATWWSDNGPTTVALASAESTTFVRYRCRECPKTWATKDGLNRHVKNCHEKKLPCPHPGCKMRFGPRAELKRHLNTVRHGGTRDFLCPQCGKELSRKDFLRRHLRGVHGVDLPKGRGANLGSTIMGG
jgi:transposase-like protein